MRRIRGDDTKMILLVIMFSFVVQYIIFSRVRLVYIFLFLIFHYRFNPNVYSMFIAMCCIEARPCGSRAYRTGDLELKTSKYQK